MVVHVSQTFPSNVAPNILQNSKDEPLESFESVMANTSNAADEAGKTNKTNAENVPKTDLNQNEKQDVRPDDSLDKKVDDLNAALAEVVAPEIVIAEVPEPNNEVQNPVEFNDANVMISDETPLEPAKQLDNSNNNLSDASFDLSDENADKTFEIANSLTESDLPVEDKIEIPQEKKETVSNDSIEKANKPKDLSSETLESVEKSSELGTVSKVEQPQKSSTPSYQDKNSYSNYESDYNFGAQTVADTQNVSETLNQFEFIQADKSNEHTIREVLNQTVEQITKNLSDVSKFKNEISFVLNPENLGKVSVRMVVEKGVLTVELSAQNKETQSILASNLESIKEVLKNVSSDNQVNQIMQDVKEDYLQQQNEQANHKNQQQAKESENTNENEDANLTENFLSILNIVNAGEI